MRAPLISDVLLSDEIGIFSESSRIYALGDEGVSTFEEMDADNDADDAGSCDAESMCVEASTGKLPYFL